jgi:hypothetical protein
MQSIPFLSLAKIVGFLAIVFHEFFVSVAVSADQAEPQNEF